MESSYQNRLFVGLDEDVVGQEQAIVRSRTGCSWSGVGCTGSRASYS